MGVGGGKGGKAKRGEGLNKSVTFIHFRYETVKDDPDDDKFIECAVALKAEVIVSGDKAVKEIGMVEVKDE